MGEAEPDEIRQAQRPRAQALAVAAPLRAGLRDMAERMLEAQQRVLWQEPGAYKAALENLFLDIEEDS